jgi:hypothetical protein
MPRISNSVLNFPAFSRYIWTTLGPVESSQREQPQGKIRRRLESVLRLGIMMRMGSPPQLQRFCRSPGIPTSRSISNPNGDGWDEHSQKGVSVSKLYGLYYEGSGPNILPL